MLITKTLSSLRTREIMPKNKKIHVFANLFLRFWLCAACSGWGGGGDGTKPPPAGTREAQVVRVTALVCGESPSSFLTAPGSATWVFQNYRPRFHEIKKCTGDVFRHPEHLDLEPF